jgi:hypothetical protein
MKKFISLLLITSLLFSCDKLNDYLPHPPQSKSINIDVPGTSNPWLAGMPNGTTAFTYEGIEADVAPAQSPILVPVVLSLDSCIEVSNVTGSVSNGPGGPFPGPDGGEIVSHAGGAEHGKSDVTAPINSIMGVFLVDDIPSKVTPVALDFGSMEARDYLELRPKLKQVFFIGDGKTSGGAQQKIFIPKGTKRLFLGTMDGYEWNNNEGAFKATVTIIKK